MCDGVSDDSSVNSASGDGVRTARSVVSCSGDNGGDGAYMVCDFSVGGDYGT